MEGGQALYDSFKEYARQEFSFENILLFEELKNWRGKGKATVSEIQLVEKEYMSPFSIYEVNISGSCKKNFLKVLDDMKNNSRTSCEYNNLDFIETEILFNMKDTFDRFENTQAFKEWSYVYNLQKSQSLVWTIP